MEEARRIMCDCGKLLCKVLDGEIIVLCNRCKTEIKIPFSEQFVKITAEMQAAHDCKYCEKRIGMFCPYRFCKY